MWWNDYFAPRLLCLISFDILIRYELRLFIWLVFHICDVASSSVHRLDKIVILPLSVINFQKTAYSSHGVWFTSCLDYWKTFDENVIKFQLHDVLIIKSFPAVHTARESEFRWERYGLLKIYNIKGQNDHFAQMVHRWGRSFTNMKYKTNKSSVWSVCNSD